MKFKLVIFDLDGTLMNTSPGIFDSANKAMVQLGRQPESDVKQLSKFIGPPIIQCFKNTYNLEDEFIEQAVANYRVEYSLHGQYNAVAYPQIIETLAQLKERGYLLAVGTLKHEELATNMMQYFELAPFFSSIRGADMGSKLTKADIVKNVLSDLKIDPSDAVLIGDTTHDLIGAKDSGVKFVAVDYGFGFPRGQQPIEGMLKVISSPGELLTFLG
ncbi:putative phosphatase [Sphaerochaeta pleomorpha str. Grapes]|uniref:Putative phosphatase n=1 Tax=Sphaerochaeta pleomorpha (strain ATCC BAA-1885 / DSM 22778 / Grapes) TaxID=158190 RepID=G8QXP3_SPHPG|nr:HAD hydrolase-like protein [Sphaerochaeta pleomorpha]AEV30687.1 putative phosphatase [Sphaerochaeta pleomorpha str. Grapes]